MNLPSFLTGAVELEMATASIYERMAELFPNSSVGRHLKALADDENRNASAIRIRTRYEQEIADTLVKISLDDGVLQKRIAEGVSFLTRLQPGYPVMECLEKMVEFERGAEGIFLAAHNQTQNPSFKHLFMTLVKSNKSHVQTLSKLIETYADAPRGGRG